MKKMRPLAILSLFFALTSSSVQSMSGSLLGKLAAGMTLFAAQQTESKWVNRYSTNFSGTDVHLGFDVAPISNDECLCVGPYGNGSFVAEFDNDGDPEWGTHIENVYFEHLIRNSRNDFFAAGIGYQEMDNDTFYAPILMNFDLDYDYDEDYPFNFQWARSSLFSFLADVNDIDELHNGSNSDEEYTIMVGTAWGAFTDNTSFTFNPRVFAFIYNGQGITEWGGVFGTSAIFDEGNSVVNEGHNKFSIAGWSAYGVGNDHYVPALSLHKMDYSFSFSNKNSSFLPTRLFMVGNEDEQPSALHGIIGLKHIQLRDGNYAFTGIYLMGENITTNNSFSINGTNITIPDNYVNYTTSMLFVGKTKGNDDAPDWFEYVEAPVGSVGYGIAEHTNDNILVIGAYEEDQNKTSTIILELLHSNGDLERGRKYSEEGFGHNLGFSINVTKNGNIFGVGGITKNDSESVDVEMLLGLWNKKLSRCGEDFEPNITKISNLLARDIDPEDLEVPSLFVYDYTPDLEIRSEFYTDRDRLCKDNDDDDYPWDLDEDEYAWVVAAYVVGAVSICCCLSAFILSRKACAACRTCNGNWPYLDKCLEKVCPCCSKC